MLENGGEGVLTKTRLKYEMQDIWVLHTGNGKLLKF